MLFELELYMPALFTYRVLCGSNSDLWVASNLYREKDNVSRSAGRDLLYMCKYRLASHTAWPGPQSLGHL